MVESLMLGSRPVCGIGNAGFRNSNTTVMNVIQPNCRIQFTAEDVEFVVSVLGRDTGSVGTLTGLLADPETRDLILDDERLYQSLLERRGCLNVSCHFYFYV